MPCCSSPSKIDGLSVCASTDAYLLFRRVLGLCTSDRRCHLISIIPCEHLERYTAVGVHSPYHSPCCGNYRNEATRFRINAVWYTKIPQGSGASTRNENARLQNIHTNLASIDRNMRIMTTIGAFAKNRITSGTTVKGLLGSSIQNLAVHFVSQL